MADDTMTPAPIAEQYQATKDGFLDKYYYKGNFRNFNAGELVPNWFSPVAQLLAEHAANRKPETVKPANQGRPTAAEVGLPKARVTATGTDAQTTEQDNTGRPSLEDAGIVKVKPTVAETIKAEPVIEPEPETVEKKVVKKKAKKKAVKKKAVKKKAKKK